MSSAPSTDQIARDATWLLQALDPNAGLARLVAMSPDSYRAASFLDDRIVQQPIDAHVLPWPELEKAAAEAERDDARWIFHIGHVGSTLVSRLLGELDGVLAIREPRALRDMAVLPGEVRDRYVAQAAKLMSRTFDAGSTACVKATSFVSEIAPELVRTDGRALFMYATPANYVASILAGENSLQELRMMAYFRTQRLAKRGIHLAAARNDADRAAAAWACEMTSLEAAAAAMSDGRVQWADFDGMLAAMEPELSRVAEFFGFEAESGAISAIVAGPLMKRYSKALEYDYSASLRGELIADATHRHGMDMRAALASLHGAAEQSTLLARALSRAEGMNVPDT